MERIGLIDQSFSVFDGSDVLLNCSELDHTTWSYNPAVLVYGTAMLYNYTNGSSIWEERTTRLLQKTSQTFFTPFENATDIMYEFACEKRNNCNNDQVSFKAYLSRFLAKTAIVAPYTHCFITPYLVTSAEAAARSCTGGTDVATCGIRWYTGDYDGQYGIGQQLSALETVQALLQLLHPEDERPVVRSPRHGAAVTLRPADPDSTLSVPSASSTGNSGGSGGDGGNNRGTPVSGSNSRSDGDGDDGDVDEGNDGDANLAIGTARVDLAVGALPVAVAARFAVR